MTVFLQIKINNLFLELNVLKITLVVLSVSYKKQKSKLSIICYTES